MDYKELQAGQTIDNFWFKAKNGLVSTLLKKTCKNKRNLRILNVGVGTGDDLKILNEYGKNYIVDIDKKALSHIKKEDCYEKRLADVCHLPYEGGYFDVVVAFDVFEHIKDDKTAIQEVHRVLKSNGLLVFSVPAFEFLFSSHDKALNHYRRYNRKEIMEVMNGFEQKLFFWNSLLFLPFTIRRLLKRNGKTEVDHMNIPKWINWLLYQLLRFDTFLINKGVSMPIGVSIVGYGLKTERFAENFA